MTEPVKQTAKIGEGKPGPGRPAGVPNRATALLKEAIIKAAEAVGEDGAGKGELTGYCTYLAKSEPKAFAQLLGKVLPMQVTGEDGGAVVVEIHRFAHNAS
jgi:hypothetical protein